MFKWDQNMLNNFFDKLHWDIITVSGSLLANCLAANRISWWVMGNSLKGWTGLRGSEGGVGSVFFISLAIICGAVAKKLFKSRQFLLGHQFFGLHQPVIRCHVWIFWLAVSGSPDNFPRFFHITLVLTELLTKVILFCGFN